MVYNVTHTLLLPLKSHFKGLYDWKSSKILKDGLDSINSFYISHIPTPFLYIPIPSIHNLVIPVDLTQHTGIYFW